MKRWILVLALSILLVGCSSTGFEEGEAIEYIRSQDKYINEEMKEVIKDINKLRDKHRDSIHETNYEYLYIDLEYDVNNGRINDILYSNSDYHGEEYFNDLVQILDRSVAPGIKDYVDNMKNKDLSIDDSYEVVIEKIGRTIVYVDDRAGDENHIAIKINFFDVENDYYREIFNEISDDKYYLEDVISGEELTLIDFTNVDNTYYDYPGKIKYNMFFQNRNIEKVNILLQGKSGAEIKDDDIEVFTNFLNQMDLKEEEKDLLLDEYKNIFMTKAKEKRISLDNYDLYINYNKGNSYSGRTLELRYFSIEKK